MDPGRGAAAAGERARSTDGRPAARRRLGAHLGRPAWEDRIEHAAAGQHDLHRHQHDAWRRSTTSRCARRSTTPSTSSASSKLLNGRGTVANQILPPLMPGYDPDYQGYDYDPEKAKALLAEAGFPDGFETSIECIAVDPQPKLCESFQQDLAKIGIKLTSTRWPRRTCHRRRRQRQDPPHLVRRPGLDPGLPRPGRFLCADPGLRLECAGRLELVRATATRICTPEPWPAGHDRSGCRAWRPTSRSSRH